MRKYFVTAWVLLALVLAVSLSAGCGSKSPTTTPTTTPAKKMVKAYTTSTKDITANVGETFVIKLVSNPTTGYQWSITGPLSPAVQKVSSIYVPTKTSSATVGSGGVDNWTFKAVSQGDALIQMEYLQAGSGQNGGTATFNVTVK